MCVINLFKILSHLIGKLLIVLLLLASVGIEAVAELIITDFTCTTARQTLECQYTYRNDGNEPLLVFDMLWDEKPDKFKRDWFALSFEGDTAVFRRTVENIPKGLSFARDPLHPHGRFVVPGRKITGSFRSELPLKEQNRFAFYYGKKEFLSHEPVRKAVFELGYAKVSSAIEEKLTKYGDERVWYGYTYESWSIQSYIRSKQTPLNLGETIRLK